MSVKIEIPNYLRKLINAGGGLEVEGRSVEDCLNAFVSRYPELYDSFFSACGKLLLNWMVYVNDELANSTSVLSRAVSEGDVIGLFPVVAGGIR